MISTEQLQENQRRIRAFELIGCGSCKATGERHVWSNGNLIAMAGEVCPACGGTAIAPTSNRRPRCCIMCFRSRPSMRLVEGYWWCVECHDQFTADMNSA